MKVRDLMELLNKQYETNGNLEVKVYGDFEGEDDFIVEKQYNMVTKRDEIFLRMRCKGENT